MSQPSGTVHVVDDNTYILESFAALFTSVGLPVELYDAPEKFLATECDGPGCLVLDQCMPGMSGHEVLRRVRKTHPALPVLLVTAHGGVPSAVEAIKDGALEYLEKPVSSDVLLDRVRAALDKSRRQWSAQEERHDGLQRYERVTPREREVLSGVYGGLTSEAIAAKLGISIKTVEVHRSRITTKMGARNVADLVRLIGRLGVLEEMAG